MERSKKEVHTHCPLSSSTATYSLLHVITSPSLLLTLLPPNPSPPDYCSTAETILQQPMCQRNRSLPLGRRSQELWQRPLCTGTSTRLSTATEEAGEERGQTGADTFLSEGANIGGEGPWEEPFTITGTPATVLRMKV